MARRIAPLARLSLFKSIPRVRLVSQETISMWMRIFARVVDASCRTEPARRMLGFPIGKWLFRMVVIFAYCVRSSAADESSAAKVEFNRDIQPILSDNCFTCHGPDSASREAGLRLDLRESATEVLDSGATAIVPGKPDQSEVVRRLMSHDLDDSSTPKTNILRMRVRFPPPPLGRTGPSSPIKAHSDARKGRRNGPFSLASSIVTNFFCGLQATLSRISGVRPGMSRTFFWCPISLCKPRFDIRNS